MNPYDLQRRLDVVFEDLLGGRTLTGLTVLDAGCGTGPFTLAARSRGARVTSVDIGIELLRRARDKGAERPVAGDAAALPFADASFDLVISSECIEHTAQPDRTVTDLLRVLRPGGTLVLTCPNRTWRWSVTGRQRPQPSSLPWSRELAKLVDAQAMGAGSRCHANTACRHPRVPVHPDRDAPHPAPPRSTRPSARPRLRQPGARGRKGTARVTMGEREALLKSCAPQGSNRSTPRAIVRRISHMTRLVMSHKENTCAAPPDSPRLL